MLNKTRSILEERQTDIGRSEPVKFSVQSDVQRIENLNMEYDCQSVGQTIRSVGGSIHVCREIDILSSSMRDRLVNFVIPVTNEILESFLSIVYDVPEDNCLYFDPVTLNNYSPCIDGTDIAIPPKYGDKDNCIEGKNYYAMFTARHFSDGTIAVATSCYAKSYLMGRNGRPLAGFINFTPSSLGNIDTAAGFREYIRVVLHEYFHALGFIGYYYEDYIDSNGIRYIEPTKEVTARGNTYTIIKTPEVAKFAKEHFACPTLEGFELENQGGAGTAQHHWEKRIGGNEIMTGIIEKNFVLTNLTMSLLDDSGFYVTNRSYAEDLIWGKGQGCTFATAKCDQWVVDDAYFCLDPNLRTCSYDRIGKGRCNIVKHDHVIPSQYQYFTDPSAGGHMIISDYCPYIATVDVCHDVDNSTPNLPVYETYGPNSRCFDVDDTHACYPVRCSAENSTYSIYLDSDWYECDRPFIEAKGLEIGCPDYELLCKKSFLDDDIENYEPECTKYLWTCDLWRVILLFVGIAILLIIICVAALIICR